MISGDNAVKNDRLSRTDNTAKQDDIYRHLKVDKTDSCETSNSKYK